MDDHNFRRLELNDVERAAEVVSQAFAYDPLCSFMLPRMRTRVGILRKFFRAYGTIYIQNHLGYGVGDPLVGVAFWLEPAIDDLSISIPSMRLFFPLLFTSYPIGYIKARRIIKQTEILHQKYTGEPHYYLDNLGVLPAEQGKGIASRLIYPFLEKADTEKKIVYTDTVTRTNVGLYEHYGFKVMEECLIEGTGIIVWALCRSNS